MFNEKINNILPKMSNDLSKNIRVLNEEFGNLNILDEDNKTLLHILVENKNDEVKTMLAIKSILNYGKIDINFKDNFGDCFIHNALRAGYSEEFILELIEIAISYSDRKFDVNITDIEGSSIVHTAIYNKNYTGNVSSIYSLLLKNGFNSSCKNKFNQNIVEAIEYMYKCEEKYTKKQVDTFKEIVGNKLEVNKNKIIYINDDDIVRKEEPVTKNIKVDDTDINIIGQHEDNKILSRTDIEKIEKLGKILNHKTYNTYPSVGRENEIESLIIGLASDKVSPLVIGESGVGKTNLIDELVYRIINDQVPEFLKNRTIIEINPTELLAGTKYSGTLEEKIKNLMDICGKYNAILFIDKIHRTIGAGTHDKSSVDMAAMLVPYMEREGIKIIGTTTIEEYNEYFANNSMKEKFYIVKVIEPDNELLYKIIEKNIIDYSSKTNITSYDILNDGKIIDLLIEVTSKKHRVYNDKINNPSLVLSIIDMAFAYAKAKGDNELKNEHFIKSLNICDRIYPVGKEKVIRILNDPNTEYNSNIKSNKSKVLRIDFTKK